MRKGQNVNLYGTRWDLFSNGCLDKVLIYIFQLSQKDYVVIHTSKDTTLIFLSLLILFFSNGPKYFFLEKQNLCWVLQTWFITQEITYPSKTRVKYLSLRTTKKPLRWILTPEPSFKNILSEKHTEFIISLWQKSHIISLKTQRNPISFSKVSKKRRTLSHKLSWHLEPLWFWRELGQYQ